MPPDRPQAPGYLANLMARLFHELSGEGLRPLGIRPEQFPILIELWFGDGASRASLVASQEMSPAQVDALVHGLADDGLVVAWPNGPTTPLELTDKAMAARDSAVQAARRANQAAAAVLSESETQQFVSLMNRVIDALQAARA